MNENTFHAYVKKLKIADREMMRVVRPIFVWLAVFLVTFISMCVWDILILMPVIIIEFLSFIPVVIICAKMAKQVHKESQVIEETLFTAREGELYKDGLRLNVTLDWEFHEISLDDYSDEGGKYGRKINYFGILMPEDTDRFMEFCRENGIDIYDEEGGIE